MTDWRGLGGLQLLGSKNTAVWLRSDERVANDLKKALMKRSDRRPVVWMSKEVTYAPLLIMHQVWRGLVRGSETTV
jgi:ABC-type polysaccharide transport system permease subunit